MDDSLEFRFVTRTLSEDYRVYADSGKRLLSDRSEFEPLRQKCGIVPEEGPCVALFEENGRVFLVASGMRRLSRDVAGRPMRFSFCQTFDAGRKDKDRAWTAFERLTADWAEAERQMGLLIREVPRGEGALLGEDIRFDQDAFMRWLQQEHPRKGRRGAAFQSCREGESFPVKSGEPYLYPLWPAAGCLLRWTHLSGAVMCRRMEGSPVPPEAPAPYQPHPGMMPKRKRWVVPAAVIALLLCAGGVLKWNRMQAERAAQESQAIARSAEAIRGSLEKISTRIENAALAAESLKAELEDVAELSRAAAEAEADAAEAGRKARVLLAAAEFLPTSGDVGRELSAIIEAAQKDSERAEREARIAQKKLSSATRRAEALEAALDKLEEARGLAEQIKGYAAQAQDAASPSGAENAESQADEAARKAGALIQEAENKLKL